MFMYSVVLIFCMDIVSRVFARERDGISAPCAVHEARRGESHDLLLGASASGGGNNRDGAEQIILTNSILKAKRDGSDIIVRPISFSAPEEIWEPVVSYKVLKFGEVIPGNESTYQFTDEAEYRKSYRYLPFTSPKPHFLVPTSDPCPF